MKYLFDETLDHRLNYAYRWVQPKGREDVLGMGTADMDFFCAPCLKESLQKVCEENTYNYRLKKPSYYESISKWYKRHYNLDIEHEWISEIPGTLGGIRMLMNMLCEKDDYVIMQTPYFFPLRRCIEGGPFRFLENPLKFVDGRYEIDFEDFEAKVRTYRPKVFLLVNPHNPTGRIFTRAELNRFVDICAMYDVKIISDEVHSLIVYDDGHHIPILDVSEKARKLSIQVLSLSKGFNCMGIPHGIIVIADPELNRQWKTYELGYDFSYSINAFSAAMVEALMSEEADDWLEAATVYLQANRDFFMEEVEKRQLPLKVLTPEASFLFWIDCSDMNVKGKELSEFFMEAAGISLNNGLDHGEDGRGFVRMNFAVTRKVLNEALDRIEKALLD